MNALLDSSPTAPHSKSTLKLFNFFNSSYYYLAPALLTSIFSLMVLLSLSRQDFTRQLMFIAIGLVAFYVFCSIPYSLLSKTAAIILLVLYLLLVVNLLVGESTRGSVRWLEIGPFTFQPSELVKPFLIIVIAKIMGAKEFSLCRLALTGLIALPGIALTFLQPDLGTALVLVFAFGIIVLFSGIKPLFAGILGGLAGLAGFIGFKFGLKDYQRARLTTFLNPQNDPLGAGYNVLQSKIAVGSGRILGKGFGHGSQSHLNFLPESKTDFIFASLAEEWGFIGSAFLIGLLFLTCWGVLYKASSFNKKEHKLLCYGVWAVLIFQIFINIGMNLGIMPVTGIPLPFVSLGGSSLLAFFIMFGTLASVAREGDIV